MESQIANRTTIAQAFNTDALTTHRILQNLGWGFFRSFFTDYDAKWAEAHPFTNEDGSKSWHDIDIAFIERYFDLFAGNIFVTSAGWGEVKDGRVPWVYNNRYEKAAINFINK